MIADSLMTMLRAGPLVSFIGSPTVSPVTAFLWACDFFPLPSPRPPASMYFFALSQAPPVFDMEMASMTPETRAPTRRPAAAFLPKKTPQRRGLSRTSAPGGSISRRDARVEICTQWSYSGLWPCMINGNWRLHSRTMSLAAIPTDFIVIAENQYGIIAPYKTPEKVHGLRTSTWWTSARAVYAPKRASDTKAADPIANPFPTAAVVLPAASNASVRSRTYSSNPAISAIPPALSEIGPYTSMVRAQTRVPSMPRADKAMPYIPATTCETQIVPPMQKHGMMHDL